MQMFVGQQVELRVSIDDIGQAYIFSLEGEYLFDAESDFKDSGLSEENNRNVRRKRAQAAKHLDKYKQAKKELQKDRKTQLEELRDAKAEEPAITFEVINGGTISVPANGPRLALVKNEKPGRRIRGFSMMSDGKGIILSFSDSETLRHSLTMRSCVPTTSSGNTGASPRRRISSSKVAMTVMRWNSRSLVVLSPRYSVYNAMLFLQVSRISLSAFSLRKKVRKLNPTTTCVRTSKTSSSVISQV
jgi:hypothetical protein